MVKTIKKEYFDYIVSLPPMNSPNLKNVQNLEIVISTSDRGAVSHALARKISKNLDRELKSKTVKYAMNQFDINYRGAGNYAFEIQEPLKENMEEMSPLDPLYREAQEVFLSEEIVKKRGKKEDPRDFIKIARHYLSFYDFHRFPNQ